MRSTNARPLIGAAVAAALVLLSGVPAAAAQPVTAAQPATASVGAVEAPSDAPEPLLVLDELPPGPESPAVAPDAIDAYARYRGQSTCDPTAKPGAVYLVDLAISYYHQGRVSGIGRDCSIGGTSEHKEGRAFDWALSVDVPEQKAAADAFVQWLTAVGPDGTVGYNARRLGVMYVIWNRYIWSNSGPSAAWQPYTGPIPHTDHVHVSLSWAGAYERTSWWTGVALPAEAEYEPYVTQVYADLFHRTPDRGGLRAWTRALADGVPRGAVADAITSSPEYRTRLIVHSYDELLSRTPDAGGQAYWLDRMNHGLTIEQMEAGFMASDEYYRQAGGTDEGWVRLLYQQILGRTGSDGEVSWWVEYLAAGANRGQVSLGFLLSTERLTTVVDGVYHDLLGRGLDSAGRASWVGAIQSGKRLEAVIGQIVASDEYWARANTLAGGGTA